MGLTRPNKLFVWSIAAKCKDVFSRIVVKQDDSVGNTEQLVCMFSELLAMTLPAAYKYRHDQTLASCGTNSVTSRLNANDPSTISN